MSGTTTRPVRNLTGAGAGAADGAGTEAAARVADVLLLFTTGPSSLGVSAISRELGLSKAVVHRILQSLASREVVVLDGENRGYRLGPAVAALGARAWRDSDLRSTAVPVLRELRDATGETTTLSELIGDARVYLDQVESEQEIKMTVETGRRFPLHAGGSGKAILAFLPEERREALLRRPLEALTVRTVVDPEQLREELAEVARSFVAISGGERQVGAGAVAAPVFGVDGHVVGSLSVCGPVQRFDPETVARHAPLVRAAGAQVSRALGWDYSNGATGNGADVRRLAQHRASQPRSPVPRAGRPRPREEEAR